MIVSPLDQVRSRVTYEEGDPVAYTAPLTEMATGPVAHDGTRTRILQATDAAVVTVWVTDPSFGNVVAVVSVTRVA